MEEMISTQLPSKKQSVFLCQTPLHAVICEAIINRENLNRYHVVYKAQADSMADRIYYERISAGAEKSLYVHMPKELRRVRMHLKAIRTVARFVKTNRYTRIYLANFGSFLFSQFVKSNPNATLVGFDDGTANITAGSQLESPSWHAPSILLSRLARLPSYKLVMRKLSLHYTIFAGITNIVDSDVVEYLPIFSELRGEADGNGASDCGVKTYFMGQPFDEYLTENELASLRNWLSAANLDCYVCHPREKTPLVSGIPVLESNGLIAEDAIFKDCGKKRPVIYAGYCTVLLTISSEIAEKHYLTVSTGTREEERVRLLKPFVSSVIQVNK